MLWITDTIGRNPLCDALDTDEKKEEKSKLDHTIKKKTKIEKKWAGKKNMRNRSMLTLATFFHFLRARPFLVYLRDNMPALGVDGEATRVLKGQAVTVVSCL